jgi:2-C-methyl-D-erythritol 4-phosphate cytidylyltransferase
MRGVNALSLKPYSRIAILLLGGLGTRFGSSKPKQFLPMGGQPLCLYGAKALENSPLVDYIVYVVPKGYERNFSLILEKAGHAKPSSIIVGGSSRQESGHIAVRYLLSHEVSPEALVLLQDGDRPRLKERYIEANFESAEKEGASVTAIPSSDSVAISKVPHLIDGYIPREEVYLLQTPQAFRIGLLSKAMEAALLAKRNFSDDGSLVLAMAGVAPAIVLGEKDNLKITTKEDQELFEEGER